MQKLNEKDILQEIEKHTLFLQNFCGCGKRLNFMNVDLTGFNFSGLNLQFANFIDCILNNCKFKNCDLYSASFKGSIGSNINFAKSICCQTSFQHCNFENCNFKSAKFSEVCYFEGANLINCKFDDINKLFEVERSNSIERPIICNRDNCIPY